MKRKRTWICIVLILLFYFCFVPSRLKISPETTGITGPLTADGQVDYFAAYEQTYAHKLYPPENNGQALLIAACGPVILEQMAMVERVPWEEMPVHEDSKRWFKEFWFPLCEHTGIDPYKRPTHYDSRSFTTHIAKFFQEKENEIGLKEENFSNYEESSRELWNKLIAAPWKAEEYPEAAKWLEARNPVLDLFVKSVRKPNFVCWRKREDSIIAILLPEVQSNREFARDLRVRITERLGRGDAEGAWYDAMSMYKFCRNHYVNDPIYVIKLVGFAIEEMGYESAKLILKEGNLTKEQLERFSKELNELTPLPPILESAEFEDIVGYAVLQKFRKHGPILLGYPNEKEDKIFQILNGLSLFPYDLNIAGKRLTKLKREMNRNSTDSVWKYSPTAYAKQTSDQTRYKVFHNERLSKSWDLLRVPLIRTRSELIADIIFYLHTVTPVAFQHPSQARYAILRTAFALERYKLEHGSYPETLDSLLPDYLDMVPLDPYYPYGKSDREAKYQRELIYKRSPEEGYTLYSVYNNGKDDGGKEDDIVFEITNNK